MTDTTTTELTPFGTEQATRAAALGIAREVLADGGAMFSGVKLDRTVNDLITVADYIVGQPAPEPEPERSPSAEWKVSTFHPSPFLDQVKEAATKLAEQTEVQECEDATCRFCRAVAAEKPDENAEAKKLAERILAMDKKRRQGFEQRVWIGFDGAADSEVAVDPETAPPFRNRKARRAAAADAALAAFRAQK